MIGIEKIKALVSDSLTDNQFIVELKVDALNKIYIELDDITKPVSISDCMAMSRAIERNFDRDIEDFSLEVTSPGLDKPFRVLKQYQKNIGRQVKVKKADGRVLKGLLKNADDQSLILETREKKRIEGRKAKQWITEEITLPMETVLETYVELVF